MRGAVLFDLDGTLVDYEACVREALEDLWATLGPGAPCSRERWLDTVLRIQRADEADQLAGRIGAEALLDRGDRFRRALEALGAPDAALATRLGEAYARARREHTRALPGAHETLRALRARGDLWLAVVSEGSGASQRRQLDRLGFTALLDDVVVSHDLGVHKPDPALVRAALGRAGVPAAAAAAVGDRPAWDLAPAKGLGLWTVFLENARYAPELARAPGCADERVPDHAALRAVLLGWAARLTPARGRG